MSSTHAFMSRGINARAEAAAQPHLDLLDAEAALTAVLERRRLLYRPNFGTESGLLLHVDADVRRGFILVSLLKVDARGDVEKNLGRVQLDKDGAIAAAGKVSALVADASGEYWASDAFVCCGGVA